MPPPPFPLPDPDAPPDPDEDEPAPGPLPSLTGRDPRTDPQPGDGVRVSGQLRSVIRRAGETLWCKDGVISYKTTVQRWKEWCGKRAEE
jgi:hypothetical protein